MPRTSRRYLPTGATSFCRVTFAIGSWLLNCCSRIDRGQSFTSLEVPEPSITSLAVSNDEKPTLYVASFHPSTHTPSLWIYHDTGGPPQGPPATQSAVSSGARAAHPADTSLLSQILGAPSLPYVGLGLGALAVILTAVVAHLRARPR